MRIRLGLALGVVAVFAPVAPAAAAPSATMAQVSGASGCLRTQDPNADPESIVTGDERCAAASALIGARGVAVLPDGSRVLVASRGTSDFVSSGGSGVSALARASDGGLSPGRCVTDNGTDGRDGTDGACVDGDALQGARAVASDASGDTLYVASASRGALAVLRRDASGAFGPSACFADDALGGRCTVVRGLAEASGVLLSPDGEHVYVSAHGRGGGVLVFGRSAADGALTPLGCVSDNGSDGACSDATALRGATGMAMSPDGRTLYVAATTSSAIDVFARDPGTGRLRQTACYMNAAPPGPCSTVVGLGGVGDLALTADGASLYATGEKDNTLVVLAVAGAGTLRSVGCVEDRDEAEFRRDDEQGASPLDACAKAPGLGGASGVAVTPDGRTVFATAFGGNALTTWARDPGTGGLTPAGCIEETADVEADGLQTEGCTPGFGLEGARDVAVAPGGVGVYVASESSSAVAAFAASATLASSVARRIGRSLAVRVACPAVRHGACRGTVAVRAAGTRGARVGRARAARLLASGARFHVRAGRVVTVRVRLSPDGVTALRGHGRTTALAVTRDLSAGTAPLVRRVVVAPRGSG